MPYSAGNRCPTFLRLQIHNAYLGRPGRMARQQLPMAGKLGSKRFGDTLVDYAQTAPSASRKGLHTLIILVCWEIRKERNVRNF
jgi:hypothetical protein